MSNISITFKNNNKIIRDSHSLGIFQALTESDGVEFLINHNSNKSIVDCGFFISPFEDYYTGTKTPKLDYHKLLWFADNFPGYGLFITQSFTVNGEVYRQDSGRLIDISRTETKDIFTGSRIEMLSGHSEGETRLITGYDTGNSLFYLDSDFSAALEGDRFKINLATEHIFKSKQGASEDFSIPLLLNAGRIDRFEEAKIVLKLKIPPFTKESGHHYFNLNLKYTSEE